MKTFLIILFLLPPFAVFATILTLSLWFSRGSDDPEINPYFDEEYHG